MSTTSIKELRKVSSLRQRRRLHFMRAALIGLCVGVVAVAFEASIAGVASIFNTVAAYDAPRVVKILITIILTSLAGLLGGAITQFVSNDASGSGIPHVKAVLLHLRGLRPLRLFPAKFIGGSLVLGSGFSLGREGPTVHLGAVVGDGIGRLLKVPASARSHLIACGAGAGLAAAFNAPLAGFLFVIEELRRELSPVTYGSAFIAALFADAVARVFFGSSPTLELAEHAVPTLAAVPPVILLGGIAGIGGVLFSKSLLYSLNKVPSSMPLWLRGAAVGAAVAIFGLLMPDTKLSVQGIIDQFLQHVVHGGGAIAFVGFLLLIKLLLTLSCYVTGVPGGIFAPMLILGGLLGVFCGSLMPTFLSAGEAVPVAVYGVIGMSALFASSVRAPITGAVLIAEMTGKFDLLFLLLVGSLCAYLTAEIFNQPPIYESLMKRGLKKDETTSLGTEPVLIDFMVEPESNMDGMLVKDLRLPSGCLLITVRQHETEIVPHGSTKLSQGDAIAVLISPEAQGNIATIREMASCN